MVVAETGVTLDLDGDSPTGAVEPPRGEDIELVGQAWVRLEGASEREWSSYGGCGTVEAGADPTSALAAAADARKGDGLGDIVGDLRRGGDDITRFEVYSAPFRIEITQRLADLLAGRWGRERDPHITAYPGRLPSWEQR